MARVSQATVSYVLNDRSTESVPEETRSRILEAVEELGYIPNAPARSLRTNKTNTIASIIPDITNPFYPAFVRGIQDVARGNGYDLIIYNSDGDEEQERGCLRSMLQSRVDGIIAVLFHVGAKDLLPFLEENVAVVRLESSRKKGGDYPLDDLYVDNAEAARHAVIYLLGKGYRRIGMIAGQEGPGRKRQEGFRQALSTQDQVAGECLVQMAGFTEQDGYDGMKKLLQRSSLPDAVFASNDLLAMGAMLAIREAGLQVPQDIALMGFDDIPSAKLMSPPLTTVSQFQRRIGRRAAEMLFERLNGQLPNQGRCEEMPFDLIIRGSA